jgi:hypothetical protein
MNCSRQRGLTRHMVATAVLLNWDLASRTQSCAAPDFSQTCCFLPTSHSPLFRFLPFRFLLTTYPRFVIGTGHVLVEWNVVDSADTEAASYASKDVGFDPIVMYLSGWTAFCHAVAEV